MYLRLNCDNVTLKIAYQICNDLQLFYIYKISIHFFILYVFNRNMHDTVNCYCSPANINENHFSETSLKKMVEIWNLIGTKKIKISKPEIMYKNLNNVLKQYTIEDNKYWLWCTILDRLVESKIKGKKQLAIKKTLKNICKKELKPEKPEAWYRNPKTWLSNYDIQNVMVQYEKTKKYKYVFLGVFPIDFAVKSMTGSCMYSSICSIDIKKYLKKGKKFIGLITNLDKHDESGSHWTSTFLVIDPNLPTYGAYYYDSTGNTIPSYLFDFIKNVKLQCEYLNPKKEFVMIQNKKQHQRKNTECGMFSMVYQIRWINKHIVKHNNTSLTEITGNPYIDDDNMLRLRDYLFRPNSKMELKRLGTI